jgi:hypothetical protein
MFADPIVVTLGTESESLPRISSKDMASVYKSADGLNTISISHQLGKQRTRSLIRVDRSLLVANNATGLESYQKHSAYLVLDYPSQNVHATSMTSVRQIVTEMLAYLTADTNAVLMKLTGLES